MSALSPVRARASASGWSHLLWVLAAAILGFVIAAVFAGQLHLERSLYLGVYAILVNAFLYGYIRWSGIEVGRLLRYHWQWGLIAAALAGTFVVINVWSQPASPSPQGGELVFDLLWLGVVYGTVDALLLSVLPILATWRAFSALGWTKTWPEKVMVGILAMVASLLVTAAYHLGYTEFQGPQVVSPLIGNGVMSLAYLLTMNPLGAVLSHIAMHVAAVLHGISTTIQLPPHY